MSAVLTPEALREVILHVHDLAAGTWMQSDVEIRKRIVRCVKGAICADDIMRGFLGYGGPEADRDIITGTGSLATKQPVDTATADSVSVVVGER